MARLRADCVRIGVTEVTVSANRGPARHPVARISGLRLPASAQARLHRLARDASYREALDQLVVQVDGPAGAAAQLRELLDALVPPADPDPQGGAGNMPGA